MDITVNSQGRMTSATYNETGGYSGELTFTYDNYGDLPIFTDPTGSIIFAGVTDPGIIKIPRVYNPHDIDVPLSYDARNGNITIGEIWDEEDYAVSLPPGGREIKVGNVWDSTVIDPSIGRYVPDTDDKTDKGGGDGITICNICPLGMAWFCWCEWEYGGHEGKTDATYGSALCQDVWIELPDLGVAFYLDAKNERCECRPENTPY